MRNAFADEVTKIAGGRSELVLLSGDIGNRLFDNYKEKHKDRFYNCGVAEANMIGVAAGLSLQGLRPIAYTITPFITSRCLEQIRIDLCYHNLPSLIVGTGSGLSYGGLGPTHHSLEDIALLRAMPNMTVLCPADSQELRALLRAALDHPGPVYMRIGKKGEPQIHQTVPAVQIGRGLTLREGDDVCLISTGNALSLVLDTATELERVGIGVTVVQLHTVKPLDDALLQTVFSRHKVIASVEEHGLIGGLGGALAEWAADHGPFGSRLLRFGTPDRFPEAIGGQSYLRSAFGLTTDSIAARILGVVSRPIE
ncbi:transketolase family protein [Azospirillum sp. B506]|uniref:transketolase family protein n=1 Tax=Azospirillum sp. B506 TaxID=137721 RepID=UPI00034C3976|nr:transketolase C-terminal domain-containing protein [Azospirillum sp. B506]